MHPNAAPQNGLALQVPSYAFTSACWMPRMEAGREWGKIFTVIETSEISQWWSIVSKTRNACHPCSAFTEIASSNSRDEVQRGKSAYKKEKLLVIIYRAKTWSRTNTLLINRRETISHARGWRRKFLYLFWDALIWTQAYCSSSLNTMVNSTSDHLRSSAAERLENKITTEDLKDWREEIQFW